jgi:quinol monooxygenase YgiN
MAENERFGLIGQLRAHPGKRDELIACLQEGSRDVPGKLAYLIALERDDPDAFWVTEIWREKADYEACLAMPQVQKAAARMRDLLAGAGPRIETTPIGPLP